MNKYNKLLLDEIQAMVNIVIKHADVIPSELDKNVTSSLETIIDELDTIGNTLKSCATFNG